MHDEVRQQTRPSFTREGLRIGEKTIDFKSAAFHYWRMDREFWESALDSLAELGFGIVETYIPWQTHELERGVFDFGEKDDRKDLVAFLELCERKAFKVIVRPGPHINAEMTYFGFPRRIVLDPQIQARTSLGTPYVMPYLVKPFPVPSYASRKLFDETRIFFDAVLPIVRRYAWPAGPIVATQSDNETGYFFESSPYALDYSADSIALYRAFLRDRYGGVHALPECYRDQDFATIEPPRSFAPGSRADLPYYFDWARYKEFQITNAQRILTGYYREHGLDLPVFHNVTGDDAFYASPYDLAGLEGSGTVDLVGIDCYNNAETSAKIRDSVKFMHAFSVLPYIPEFSSGGWYSHVATYTPAEEEFAYLYAYMHGLRAYNAYMAVERDRWQGCPVTRRGGRREEYAAVFEKLARFERQIRIGRLRKVCRVLVLHNYDMCRLESLAARANFTLLPGIRIPNDLFKVDPDLGFSGYDDLRESPDASTIGAISAFLQERGIDFDYGNSAFGVALLGRYDMVILPTFDFLDKKSAAALRSYAASGGLAVIGPTDPYLDEDMLPAEGLLDAVEARSDGPGRIVLIKDGWSSLADLLEEKGIVAEYSSRDVELTVHRDDAEGAEYLFAANCTGSAVRARLRFPDRRTFLPVINGTTLSGDGEAEFDIEPYSVACWETQRK